MSSFTFVLYYSPGKILPGFCFSSCPKLITQLQLVYLGIWHSHFLTGDHGILIRFCKAAVKSPLSWFSVDQLYLILLNPPLPPLSVFGTKHHGRFGRHK